MHQKTKSSPGQAVKGFCELKPNVQLLLMLKIAPDHAPVGSLHFAQSNSAGLPCYKILHSGFLNVPLPDGMHLKIRPEGHHIFNQLSSPMAQKGCGCDAR
jgi:hypothetical protein